MPRNTHGGQTTTWSANKNLFVFVLKLFELKFFSIQYILIIVFPPPLLSVPPLLLSHPDLPPSCLSLESKRAAERGDTSLIATPGRQRRENQAGGYREPSLAMGWCHWD